MICASPLGKSVLQNIIVSDRHALVHGIYTVRFWKEGRWVYITIDDRIPCDISGSPMYSHSKNLNDVFVMVIEKAYAKLHGSYMNLESGKVDDALRDLTGGVPERLECNDWSSLDERLGSGFINPIIATKEELEQVRSQHIVGARIGGGFAQRKRNDGIVSGQVYGVVSVIKSSEKLRFVKLVDMWRVAEWRGRWSNSDLESWRQNPAVKAGLCPDDEWPPGVYFMSWEDFQDIFTEIICCALSVSSAGREWVHNQFAGKFEKHSSFSGSGGSPNNDTAWLTNPMIPFTVETSTDIAVVFSQPRDERVAGFFTTKSSGFTSSDEIKMSKDENQGPKKRIESSGINLFICRLGKPGCGLKRLRSLSKDKIVTSGGEMFRNARQVGCFYSQIPKGEYVAVPCTFEQELYGDYVVEIYVAQSATAPEAVKFHIDTTERGFINKTLDKLGEDDKDVEEEEEESTSNARSLPVPKFRIDDDPFGIDDLVDREYLEKVSLQRLVSKLS
mmetsp:Transcript_15168/g.26743  ORF Transcript_15168/g.26743 Transcript_15168/m.26743 type:complete len:502 (-) Transcript_15168:1350-2855(-)